MDNLPADLLRTAGAGRVIAGGLIFDRAIEIGYRQTVQVLENSRRSSRTGPLRKDGLVTVL